MNRAMLKRSVVGAGALVAVAALFAAPVAAEEIYPEQWDQLQGLIASAIPEDQLGGVTGQNFEAAWQSIDLPTTEDLSPAQKSELNQIKSGELQYVVEIPPEDREPGGPTQKIVTAPTAFGGMDNLITTLAGDGALPVGSQMQSTNIGDLSGGFMESGFGNALGSSALTDALTGFQPQ